MQCVLAKLKCGSDRTNQFEQAFLNGAATVHANEPGCLAYQLAKDTKRKGEYYVLEVYQSKESLKTHMANLKKNPNKALVSTLAGRPELKVMSVIGNPGIKVGSPSIAIVAEIPCKDMDGMKNAILPALNQVHTKETGNLMYCAARDESNQNIFFLELYTGMEAIKTHGKTEYFKAMGKRQAPHMGGKIKLSILHTVGPSGAKASARL